MSRSGYLLNPEIRGQAKSLKVLPVPKRERKLQLELEKKGTHHCS